MTFANPLGLVALVAIPAIIAIHLFRRRFPRRPVAGLFLWPLTRKTPEGGGRITKLPITLSLILECLAALALALILAGARLSSAGVSAHLVVLLDDSASMSAIGPRGESARDRAGRRVLAEIDRLGARGRVTLVVSGERPSVLAGPAAFPTEARSALNGWKPEAAHHSLALGVRLARELAGTTGRLMIVSDLPPAVRADGDVAGAFWVAVGEALANVGIAAADRRLSPDAGHGTVSLGLVNHSDAPARRRVTISADGKDVVTEDLEIPAGKSSVTLPLPPGLPPVRVALSDDALMRDNEVTLAEPRLRIVAVDNRLAGLGAEARSATAAGPGGQGAGQPGSRGYAAVQKAIESLSGVTRAEPGHLAFVDARELDRPVPPGVWRVGFGRAPDGWIAAGDARDFIGPFVLEKRHPLLVGVTLGGVVWTGALPLTAGAVRPLVAAGDQPIIGMAAGARGDPAILFNVDLDRTNLIRAPDWPILVSNVVEMRRQHLAGPERWNYRVGEWIRVRLENDPKSTLRFRCGPAERTLPAGRQLEFIAPAPGGRLQILDGEALLFELGVNFIDDTESNLRSQTTMEAGEAVQTAALGGDRDQPFDPLFWVLLTIGAGALIGNWCLLRAGRA